MEKGLTTSGNPDLRASGDDVRRRWLNVLGSGVLHGALSGALLGAALPTLLLSIALVADELELLGPRYGSPDLDLASILVIALVVLIGAPIGAMMGLVVGCLVGAANGLLVLWLERGIWTSSRRTLMRLLTAGLSIAITPFLFQIMANTLGLRFDADFLGVGALFWTAGLVTGAASWWISGRLISTAGNPVPLP
jgi:hypothetical protein